MPSTSRRTLLRRLAAGAALGAAAGLAGCSSSCPDSGTPEPETVVNASDATGTALETDAKVDWPAPHHGPTNVGYTAAASAPESPTVHWETKAAAVTERGPRSAVGQPTVADGRVYLVGAEGVVALALSDGAEAWTYTDLTPGQTAVNFDFDPYPVAPVVGGDGAVHVAGENAFVALDPADGSERWRYEMRNSFGTPAVSDGTVYVGTSTGLVALDAASGEELWAAGDEVSSLPPAVAGGRVLVGGAEARAFDAASGELRWRTERDTEGYPVVADDLALFGGYGGLQAYALGDGTEQWTFERGDGRTISSPVVTPDAFYVVEQPGEASDATFALDRTDGEPSPRWCSEIGSGAVAAATDETAMTLLEGGGPGGADSRLVALSSDLGDSRWAFDGQARLLPPAVLDGALVVADRDGTVVAIGGA